ncbi:hypothetical protein G6F57_017112 [Rhizopus arrhizus]|nr:hypothetical protein G6F24_017981 [Rhizopus arrhizus]KAG1447269.1 hypothetical protein G6F57_017112 [Rhizopus arrhizus]
MGTPVGDRNNLIMAAQTGDAAALSRLLAVCQADARRYAITTHHFSQGQRAKSGCGLFIVAVHGHQARMPQARADDVQARATA